MVAEMEVVMGQQVPIFCPYTGVEEQDYPLVEWFTMDKTKSKQLRVAYNDKGKVGVDRGTEYTERVFMDANNSLVITAIDVNDEKLFSCQVTSGFGSDTGRTQLKVFDPPEPPELTQNSGTLSVTADVALEIAVCTGKNGYPAPTVSWYKDGQFLNITTEHNKELYEVVRTVKEASGLYSRSSVLYMRPKKADKNSVFQCKLSYKMPNGVVSTEESQPFNLTLHYYTENVQFALDSPKVIKEGDDVKLQCQGDGFPQPEYSFSKVQSANQLLDLPTTTDGVLLLPQVTKADSGTYRCQVLDFYSPSEVELEKDVNIFIHYLDPLVLNPTKTVRVNRSEDLQLTCSGNGSNIPTLSWRKGRQQVGTGETLSLQGLTYSMAGTYVCEASVPSISGLKRNESVQVIVEGKPEVDIQQTIIQELEQTVKLTCTVFGHPQPEIRWSIPGGKAPVKHSANKYIAELLVELTPKLIQSGVQCTAENKYGSAKRNFELKMVTPTLSVTSKPASEEEQGQTGSTMAVIAVCVCVLVLLLIVGFFYFMQRRGHLPCSRGEKRSLTPKEGTPDNTVVEMRADRRNEQTGLLNPGGGGSGGGGRGTNEC
ncbi:PREDICTED: basal cell adhesion molecule-like [Thamnophis sirtalis]|uniref:Basal cell adhesion molecule-like n=1 Tax=Thamnophis sirtalis TaxID=35019 RepID=A0A6I9YD40_9SAUR|nr:PREDICTED: basal cell adhesion molecule-like [Thamnophis sirtalis]